jgi:hypothetical protein
VKHQRYGLLKEERLMAEFLSGGESGGCRWKKIYHYGIIKAHAGMRRTRRRRKYIPGEKSYFRRRRFIPPTWPPPLTGEEQEKEDGKRRTYN